MVYLKRSESPDIYYEVRGEGSPLVLIHGLRANSSWWSPDFLLFLIKHFKVILIDLRGTGRSSKEKLELLSFNELAEDVVAVLNQLEIEKCHVLGFSMGGRVVQSLLTNHSNRINKAILASSICMTKSYLINQSLREMTSKEFIHFFLPRFFTAKFSENNPLLVNEFCERTEKFKTPFSTYELQLDAIKQFQGCKALHRVNHEVLIIHGKLDSFIPVKHAYQLQTVLEKSVLYIIPNEGHLIFDTDGLEQKAELIINFLF